MNQGKLVFAQVMQHLPLTTFRRCVSRYQGEHKVQSFSCLDQFLCMAFAQLTFRESLRDIEACQRAQPDLEADRQPPPGRVSEGEEREVGEPGAGQPRAVV